MSNRFLNREDPTQFEEINENQIIVNILREEFPNDAQLQKGKLSLVPNEVPTPVALASRNKYSRVLELDADLSASYAEYPINKLVPSVNDEELDEILLDEFEFYLNPSDSGFAPPAPDGLFLRSIELDARQFDYHDLYLKQGPESIPEKVAAGRIEDELINEMFCIWYVERGIARPITNYKTLEVMLVERGLTYDSITEAQESDFTDFDLRLDGRFEGDVGVNEIGEPNPSPTLLDELTVRSVTDRSYEWNAYIRFRSGYKLGTTTNGFKFYRDPGDYIQLRNLRLLTPPSDEDVKAVRQNRKGLEWPRLSETQDVCPRLYRYYLNDVEYISMNLIKADPEDFYQDTCLLPPTDLEVFRGQYEGKLIILKWPTQGYVRSIIEAGTSNTQFDDLIFDLRFMIHGHLKGVLSLRTLKDIARIQGINISAYEGGLEDYPVNELTGQLLDANSVNDLDDEQFEALSAQNGIIQVLAQAGAIEVLGETRIDTGVRRVWDDFSQIVQINRLDPDEYEKYRRYESNNLDMFGVEELEPFEPRGALIYYPLERYEILQEQAIQQEFFDAALIQIKELFPPVAAACQEFSNKLSGIQGGFLQQVKTKFDYNSDLYKIANAGGTWVLAKRKNSGDVKDKGSNGSFFRLWEKESFISSAMKGSEENQVFWDNGKPWCINTLNPGSNPNTKDTNAKATELIQYQYVKDGIQLISSGMVAAGTDAQKGSGAIHQPGDKKGSLGNGNQRYGRPERSGRRQREQMKDPQYLNLCIAQYILEAIIDPGGIGASTLDDTSPDYSPPANVISGQANQKLTDQAQEADTFLAELTSQVDELSEYIATIDGRLIRATTVEELEDILNILTEARNYYASIDEDLFSYLAALEAYINNQYTMLGKRIVKAINKVRKHVNDKNGKYFILWPGANRTTASKFYQGVDYDASIPELED